MTLGPFGTLGSTLNSMRDLFEIGVVFAIANFVTVWGSAVARELLEQVDDLHYWCRTARLWPKLA